MSWKITTFETQRKEQPIDEFIKMQQPQTIAKIVHVIDLLEQYGNQLGMPHSKNIGNGLHELRIRGKEEIRLLYCFYNRQIIILHAFKKQTQKTPHKEITIARNRMLTLT